MPDVAKRVYIISDLHLGGASPTTSDVEDRGFRINTHVEELAAFVRAVAALPGAVEIVIDGDAVDFLAEANATGQKWVPFTTDPKLAAQKLEDIATREKAFFSALGEFLDRGHRLTILMGNHDAELAFPLVRQKLKEKIGVKGNHDYEFIHNGEAYIAGDALIEHGNRYDSFNTIDYDSLRRICSLQSRRRPEEEERDFPFTIPAGSNMVSWVINPIKEQYRFVDLLKPETGAVIPFLLALEPGYRSLLAKAVKFQVAATQHKLAAPARPSFGGDISSTSTSSMSIGGDMGGFGGIGGGMGGMSAAPKPAPAPEDPLQKIIQQNMAPQEATAFMAGIKPAGAPGIGGGIGSDISTMDTIDRSLGLFKLLVGSSKAALDSRLPALLSALRALQTDQTFDEKIETAPEYITSAKCLAKKGNFRYVVFGHTHLPKRVPMEAPGSFYLNSGTWVDLIRFPVEILSGAPEAAMAGVRDFCGDLQKGSLSRWIHYQPTFARLDFDADGNLLGADIHTWKGPDSI